MQWRGWHPKNTPPPHMHYHVKFGHSPLDDVGINTAEPQNPLCSLGMRHGTPQDTRLSTACFQAKFGSCVTKGVCTNTKEPRKLRSTGTPPFGQGHGSPLKTIPLPYVTTSNLVVLCQRVYAWRYRNPKIWSSGAPPIGVGGGWPLETCPSLVCYFAEFGHSISNTTSVLKEIRLKSLTPLSIFQGYSRSL